MICRMSGDFVYRIFAGCRHQFSWPRRAEDGDYYQLCVHCGVKYRYDWGKMRRVARLAEDEPAEQNHSLLRKCGKKIAWTPRERRLRHRVPLHFRVPGTDAWVEAECENISRTGVLFRSPIGIQIDAHLEFTLEMPRELTGDAPAEVRCVGTVCRVSSDKSSRKEAQSFLIACSIAGYEYAEQPKRSGAAANVVEITKTAIRR